MGALTPALNAHMPHVCGEHIVFCVGEEASITYPATSFGKTGVARLVPWEPHIATLIGDRMEGFRKLRLGANVRVCSPYLETGNGWAALTYVIEQPLGRLRLVRRESFNVDGLESAKPTELLPHTVFCGCRWRGKNVWSDGGETFHVGEDVFSLTVNAVLRTCPTGDKLLITVQRLDDTFTTLIFDGSGIKEIRLPDGGDAYKCCIVGSDIIHAKRGEGFEDRTLWREAGWKARPSPVQITRL